ncbi:MAG TPA: DoxX family membrane protein [Thermoanaerobaculia bacterium]|nr:DoxX family membrane protein [Thermoanaerobaculia bacterium]
MTRFARVYARIAIGSAFLSAVAQRFAGPGAFAHFIGYTGEVNSFMPRFTIPFLAVAATIAETTLGILLIAGFRIRWTGLAASILLAMFGVAMAISFGITSPMDYSVFSASAGALLLSTHESFADHRTRSADRTAVVHAPALF